MRRRRRMRARLGSARIPGGKQTPSSGAVLGPPDFATGTRRAARTARRCRTDARSVARRLGCWLWARNTAGATPRPPRASLAAGDAGRHQSGPRPPSASRCITADALRASRQLPSFRVPRPKAPFHRDSRRVSLAARLVGCSVVRSRRGDASGGACAARRVPVAKSGGPNTAPEEGVCLPPGMRADPSLARILRRRRIRLSPTRQEPCFRISRPQRPFPADAVPRGRRLGSSGRFGGAGPSRRRPGRVPARGRGRAPALRPGALRAGAARQPLPRIALLNRRRPLAPALRPLASHG